MKKIRLLSLLMVVAMLFSACAHSSGDSEVPSTTPSQSSTQSSGETVETGETGEDHELEYVKLKYVNYGSKPTSGTYDQVWEKINEMLLEDLNCEIEVEWLEADSTSKIALKYATGEVFDFAYDADWYGYASNAVKNAYREITPEEIHEYMPLIEEQLEAIGWEQSKIGGKIYMIPSSNNIFIDNCILLRGDLRQKYNLDPVETVEDYLEYCRVIAENEPTMEAVQSGETVMRLILNDNQKWKNIHNSSYTQYDLDEAIKGNYVCFNAAFTEEFLEFCKLMRQCYEEKLWAADSISNTTDRYVKMENGLLASFIYNVQTVGNKAKQYMNDYPEWQVEVCNPLTGNEVISSSHIADGTCINRLSENPERAMMALNLLQGDPRYNYLINYGLEGVNWELNEEGKLITLETDEANVYDPGCNWNFVNSVVAPAKAGEHPEMEKLWEGLRTNTVQTPMQGFVFDTSSVTDELANIKDVIASNNALLYGMVEDVEGAVQSFREQLTAAGVDKVLEVCQQQITDYIAQINQ